MLQDPAEMTGNTLTAKCQAGQLYYSQRVSSDAALQTNLTFSLLSGEIQRSITVWTESAEGGRKDFDLPFTFVKPRT